LCGDASELKKKRGPGFIQNAILNYGLEKRCHEGNGAVLFGPRVLNSHNKRKSTKKKKKKKKQKKKKKNKEQPKKTQKKRKEKKRKKKKKTKKVVFGRESGARLDKKWVTKVLWKTNA